MRERLRSGPSDVTRFHGLSAPVRERPPLWRATHGLGRAALRSIRARAGQSASHLRSIHAHAGTKWSASDAIGPRLAHPRSCGNEYTIDKTTAVVRGPSASRGNDAFEMCQEVQRVGASAPERETTDGEADPFRRRFIRGSAGDPARSSVSAHAGTTRPRVVRRHVGPAHPRQRGNDLMAVVPDCEHVRSIRACAGTTSARLIWWLPRLRFHPPARVRRVVVCRGLRPERFIAHAWTPTPRAFSRFLTGSIRVHAGTAHRCH